MDGFWSRVSCAEFWRGGRAASMRGGLSQRVMPGLVPGIHDRDKGVTVDGRDKPGHDGVGRELSE